MKPLSLMDVLVPFVPMPKQMFWVSENDIRFHIETALSNDKAGQEFTALCGVKGDYLHQRGASQNFMRCEKCLELSSVTSILDSLDQGKAPQRGIDSLRVGDEGGEVSEASPLKSLPCSLAKDRDGVGGTMEGHGDVCIRQHTVIPDGDAASENQASPSDSQSLPVHPRSGETGAADCTSLDAAPEKYIGRFDSSTNHFMEFVDEKLSLRTRIDADMRLRSHRNFSVSSQFDPADDPRFA